MQSAYERLDNYLQTLFEKKKLTGISVAAFGPGGEMFAKGYGRANGDGSRLCDENTIFGIASMSKSMVTLACAILATEGKLSFDDPVYFYFPKFDLPGTPKDAVTLRHLAMHSAGIPPLEALEWSIAMHSQKEDDTVKKLRMSAPNSMETIDQIIEYIAACGYPLLGAPGEQMSYSNEGYAILSYVVDQAAGMPLERFLKERVYRPLSMTRTILDIDASEARVLSGGNITSLFKKEDDKITCDDEWSVLSPYRGCGLVKSTARDMAAYYRCLSNMGMHEGKQAIPREAVEMILGKGFPAMRVTSYCYGLYKREWEGHVICEHSGGLHGVSSHGGLLLGEGWGFAALCNLGEQDVDSFVWPMYNHVIGRPLDEKHRWYRAVCRDFSNPEMVVGTYRSREGIPVDVSIYENQGKLFAAKEEERMLLTYCGETLFVAFDEEDEVLMRVEALIRDGRAWAIRCGSRVYQMVSVE